MACCAPVCCITALMPSDHAEVSCCFRTALHVCAVIHTEHCQVWTCRLLHAASSTVGVIACLLACCQEPCCCSASLPELIWDLGHVNMQRHCLHSCHQAQQLHELDAFVQFKQASADWRMAISKHKLAVQLTVSPLQVTEVNTGSRTSFTLRPSQQRKTEKEAVGADLLQIT